MAKVWVDPVIRSAKTALVLIFGQSPNQEINPRLSWYGFMEEVSIASQIQTIESN
jgi:hypothetical protein